MSTTIQRAINNDTNGGGLQIIGASSVTVALNDTTGTTLIQGGTSNNFAWAACNLDTAVFPAGAQIRSHTIKLYLSGTGGQIQVRLGNKWLTQNTKPGSSTTWFQWTTTTGDSGPLTPAGSANLQVYLGLDVGVKCYQLQAFTVYNEQPVVTAPTMSGNPATPTVAWVYTDPDGDMQERYRVKTFPDYRASAAGFNPDTSPYAADDSGDVFSSSRQYTVKTPLQPGSYSVYVKASDAGSNGRYSLWTSTTYAVAGTPPATPALVSATTDATNGRNVFTIAQNDNLISYNQGSFELADGSGWYIDSNVSALATTTTAATNVEGTKVLAMTCASTSNARIRSGGTWATAGLGGTQNLQIRTYQFTAVNSGNSNASVQIAAAAGSTLFAFTTDDVDGEGAITVSSAPSLTWTLVKRQGKTDSGRRDAVTIYRSSATSAATYTIQTNNGSSAPAIGVVEITGAATNPVGAFGGGGTTGIVNASYTSTAAGSWGFLVYADWNAPGVPSPDANSIRLSGYTSSNPNVSMIMRRVSATSLAGQTVNLTTVSPTGGVEANYAYVEILPASSPPGVPSTSLAGIPVIAGQAYTKFASCWLANPANTGRNVRMDVEWYDVTGALLSTTQGGNFGTVGSNLLAAQAENVTAPANAVCAVLVPQTVDAPAAGNVYHWDRMGLTHGADSRWFRGGMQAQNLLTCDQGSLQNSIGGWTVPSLAASYSTADRFAYVNVKPGQVLRTYVSSQPKTAIAQTASILAVEAGLTYTGYALAISAAGTPNGWLTLTFVDAEGQAKGSATGSPKTLGPAAWQLMSVTGIMPAGATSVQLGVNAALTATGTANAVYWTWLGITPGNAPPAVWQPGPTPNTFPLVESSDDGGATWVKVRGCENNNYNPANNWQAVVYDYEAPSNVTRLYRASTAGLDYGLDPLGLYTVSAPSGTTALTLPVTEFYLVDPYVPTRFFMEQEGEIDVTAAEPQTVFSPLGRTTEIITYDVTKSKHLTVVLGMLNGTELDTFEALRDSGHILFLQTPYPRSWYVKIGAAQATKWLLSPDATGRFNVTVDLIEVARPD